MGIYEQVIRKLDGELPIAKGSAGKELGVEALGLAFDGRIDAQGVADEPPIQPDSRFGPQEANCAGILYKNGILEMEKMDRLTAVWFDDGPVIVPDGQGRFAAIASGSVALENVGVSIHDEIADGIQIPRLQIAQIAIVERGIVILAAPLNPQN